ncbi:MAG: hypothetical protein QOF47_1328, partial [Mycobacterium sp.]|nr:hypothetical protein [Mycobacterium sp.]
CGIDQTTQQRADRKRHRTDSEREEERGCDGREHTVNRKQRENGGTQWCQVGMLSSNETSDPSTH